MAETMLELELGVGRELHQVLIDREPLRHGDHNPQTATLANALVLNTSFRLDLFAVLERDGEGFVDPPRLVVFSHELFSTVDEVREGLVGEGIDPGPDGINYFFPAFQSLRAGWNQMIRLEQAVNCPTGTLLTDYFTGLLGALDAERASTDDLFVRQALDSASAVANLIDDCDGCIKRGDCNVEGIQSFDLDEIHAHALQKMQSANSVEPID